MTERALVGPTGAAPCPSSTSTFSAAASQAWPAALGGLDACLFNGGVGGHAPQIRSAAVEGLGFLEPAVDPARERER